MAHEMASTRCEAIPTVRQTVSGILNVLVCQIFGLVLSLLQLYLAQRHWGDEGLDYFTQWRRFTALVIPLALLGHSISLARELGRAHDDPLRRTHIMGGSLIPILALLLALAAGTAIWPGGTAMLLLGSARLSSISGALGLGVLGQGLTTLGEAYLRGRFSFFWSAALPLIVLGIVPICGLQVLSRSTPAFGIWCIAATQVAVAAVPTIAGLARFCLQIGRPRLGALLRESWVLTRFGVARVPMLAASAVLNGFGAWQLARHETPGDLGIYNSLCQLANATGIVLGATMFTLLPILSAILKGDERKAGSRVITLLIQAALSVSLHLSLQLFLFGPSLVPVLLQREIDIYRFAWGGVFLVLVGRFLEGCVASPLDAHSAIPYQLISYVVGLAALLGTWQALALREVATLSAVVTSVAIGLTATGATSLFLARVLFKIGPWDSRTAAGLLAVIIVGAAGVMERGYLGGNSYVNIGWLVINTALLGAVWCILRPPWLTTALWKLFRPTRPGFKSSGRPEAR